LVAAVTLVSLGVFTMNEGPKVVTLDYAPGERQPSVVLTVIMLVLGIPISV